MLLNAIRLGFIAIATLALGGCGRSGGSAFDELSAYNTRGGARHANDYTRHAPTHASSLRPVGFPALRGGLLGPPLELPLGRLAFIARSDSATTLAIVQRDSVLYRHTFAPGQHPMPGIAADSAGTLYAITTRGVLFAFSPELAVLWRKDSPGDSNAVMTPGPLLALDAGVVTADARGHVARYDRNGRLMWQSLRGASASGGASATRDQIVLAVTHNSYDESDTVVALDPATGRQRWARPLAGLRVLQGPAIVGDHVLVGAARRTDNDERAPSLVALAMTGAEAWRTELLLLPRGIGGDSEGNSYVAMSGTAVQAMGGAVASFDRQGKRRWQATFRSGVPAAPVVTANWIFFISRSDGRTGLFTYGRDGAFQDFVSIDLLPDVHANMMVASTGQLMLAGLDEAVLLLAD